MSNWIEDDLLWQAIADASGSPALGRPSQWAGVVDYAKSRGPDPWPERAYADASPEQLRVWLAEDIQTAAPLLTVFTGHGTDVEHQILTVPAADLAPLGAWLSCDQGSPVEVVRAEVIGGGFSRRMWRAVIRSTGWERRVIVRIEQGGMFGTDTRTEVAAMRALRSAGFRVPEILHVEETGDILGQPFFVMEEISGQVRLDDEGLDDVIRSIADLHKIPVAVLDQWERSPEEVITRNIDGWLRLYRTHSRVDIPLIDQAADWLHEHLQPTGPSVIVHGDAGPGNALFHPDRGVTVLDWEFAHVGDKAEDWSYLAMIRGRRIMDPAAWKARLQDRIGLLLTEDQWRTWAAFQHFRGACVNLTALTVFRHGPHRTPDQLAIGVAVHLRFLEQLATFTGARITSI